MTKELPFVFALPATPAFAEETRQLDSHEHGVGELNIAADGSTIAMEFQAPGADIVGFEYAAETAEDRSAIDAAVATLAHPLELIVLSSAAECNVVQASAEIVSQASHDEHVDQEGDHEEDHAENRDVSGDDHADVGHRYG